MSTSLIESLLARNAAPRLELPAPTDEEWKQIQQASINVPDHAQLKPWRFLKIEGDARITLGNVFLKSALAKQPDMPVDKQEQLRNKALRAPVIVAIVVCLQQHPKVPEVEQWLSAGCAAHNILLSAESLGYAGVWRTGDMAYDPIIMQGLGLADNERLAGFLYIGTRIGDKKIRQPKSVDDYWENWA